jgi:peptide/nickel transport system substrate-binding protein
MRGIGLRSRIIPRALSCAICAAALAACGGSMSGGAGRLVVLQYGDIQSLDPALDDTPVDQGFIDLTQRPLYADRPGSTNAATEPDLASEAPEISADGHTITVRIRAGVRFSPPVDRAVTAADVAYAIERGFSATVASPYALEYFSDIVGAPAQLSRTPPEVSGLVTPNPLTLVIHLRHADAGTVAAALVTPVTAPVPRSYALPFDRHTPSTYALHEVASGPYMIADNAHGNLTGYRPGQSIQLVRNPNWNPRTDFRPARPDSILFRLDVPNGTVAASQVLAGSHMMFSSAMVPPDRDPALRAQTPELHPPSWVAIQLNTTVPPLNSRLVRRAVIAATDRVALRALLGGPAIGTLATHFLPPDFPGFAAAGGVAGPPLDFLAHPAGDLALAQRYMRAAGYPSGRYVGGAVLDMPVLDDPPTFARAGEILRENLARIGLKVQVEPVSPSEFLRRCTTVAARTAICDDSWTASFIDGEAILAAQFDGARIAPVGNLDWSMLNDPAINASVARATLLAPGSRRVAAWARIDDMITATAPAIPVIWPIIQLAESRDVRGVVLAATEGWAYSFTALR